MDPRLTTTMFSTIQQMKFHLRTGFGDSEEWYGGNMEDLPMQGVCQGNGGGPALWCATSAPIVSLQHRLGNTSEIQGTMSQEGLSMVGFLFVDDTDLVVFAREDQDDPETIIQVLQERVRAWHGSLRATGGALRAEKCSWSIAAYHWKEGNPQYHSVDSLPGQISITDQHGQEVPLTRHEVSTAIKVVGVVQSLDGSMDGQ